MEKSVHYTTSICYCTVNIFPYFKSFHIHLCPADDKIENIDIWSEESCHKHINCARPNQYKSAHTPIILPTFTNIFIHLKLPVR